MNLERAELTRAFRGFAAGGHGVLIGAPGSIGRNSIVQLRDTTNAVVDEVDLSVVHAALGFATGEVRP